MPIERDQRSAENDVRQRVHEREWLVEALRTNRAAHPSSGRSDTSARDASGGARRVDRRIAARRAGWLRRAGRSRETRIGSPRWTANRPGCYAIDEAGKQRCAGSGNSTAPACAGTMRAVRAASPPRDRGPGVCPSASPPSGSRRGGGESEARYRAIAALPASPRPDARESELRMRLTSGFASAMAMIVSCVGDGAPHQKAAHFPVAAVAGHDDDAAPFGEEVLEQARGFRPCDRTTCASASDASMARRKSMLSNA